MGRRVCPEGDEDGAGEPFSSAATVLRQDDGLG